VPSLKRVDEGLVLVIMSREEESSRLCHWGWSRGHSSSFKLWKALASAHPFLAEVVACQGRMV
jgi:hypothetical protein